jgi:toxin ParE1/3/4
VAREIIWTDPGWEDVENAANYIAEDSEFYAAAFIGEIKQAAASLVNFADRGQVVPEFDDASVRELLVRSYRLVYNISEK